MFYQIRKIKKFRKLGIKKKLILKKIRYFFNKFNWNLQLLPLSMVPIQIK